MSVRISEVLPAPSHAKDQWESAVTRDPWFKGHSLAESSTALVTKQIPSYGKRAGYIPRAPEDFGDGGAFPEIHIAQYPLGMGKDSQRGAATSQTVALQYDAEGKLNFDAIVKQGHGANKIVYTKLGDTKSRMIDEEDPELQKPSADEVAETTMATKAALEKLVQSKVASALPVQHAKKVGDSQFIRYTPSAQSATGRVPQQRIIRMVEEQVDPMEPPKFKINQKIPRPPPSPPAPVLHSPTRRPTAQQQAEWKIPPCISNWKNPKGYTVALDKRLAADGRGMQQTHINENFAKFSEALQLAERAAREAVEERNQYQKAIALKEKAEQEKKMREIALQAKKERAQAKSIVKEEEDEEKKERDRIRQDRKDDIRRERNIIRGRPDKADKIKGKADRDISEKIALGIADPRSRNGDNLFDSRLFDQTKGLDSGGIDDETYNVYDQPWRSESNISQIYRPTKSKDNTLNEDMDRIITTNRFVSEKGFSGADAGTRTGGPVQFEKAGEDIFGLDDLLTGNESSSSKRKHGGNDDYRSSKHSRH
uniref:SKI-interacting protein SKIP SNW domain-containing protein n=1 Tax=Panagrolaimus sp. JU765 TaxID=591449 RepID=A0AC34R7V0_9BILA